MPKADGWKRGTKERVTTETAVGSIQVEDTRHHWEKANANETTSTAVWAR